MTELWDTTIRLLSQEPLARHVETGRLLEVAQVLDRAGFRCLEVSGGGCFDHGIDGGVESPWERIRALASRCQTPLAIGLRGRFLVGSRPLPSDLVRRFIWSAAESGIDVFRIHDPLNDMSSLTDAAAAVRETGKSLVIGLAHNPGPTGEDEGLVDGAREAVSLGATRIIVDDPAGSLDAAHARALVERVREATGLPVGLYCQGAGGRALAAALEAARGGGSPIGCAIYPVAITLYRPSAEALAQSLAGIGLETGIDVAALWDACRLIDEEFGDLPVPPLSPRDAVRAAEHGLSAGLVSMLDARLRAYGQRGRLDEVLAELIRVRAECGSPPLHEPIGLILGSQALIHVLSAQRWQTLTDEARLLLAGQYGQTPMPVDPVVRRAAELLAHDEPIEAPGGGLAELRESAKGLATSDEELLLLALFGDRAEPLLRTIRARARGEEFARHGVDETRAARIRELIELVQESGIGEVTIEEGELRVTVRRTQERAIATTETVVPSPAEPAEAVGPRAEESLVRVESPMVGVFYRAAAPDQPAFVEVGGTVEAGQTLCLLEAMKLFNEVRAEIDAIVREIHVENEQAVEYGQLLFELEPVAGRPSDAF
ncbi:MAG: acetyl-CoA carboxylase biotin carboxyl carrier protein [Gaiellales bacterium]